MPSSLRLLPLLFVLPVAFAADDPPIPARMSVVDGGVKDDGKGPVFWLEVESDLPETTSIELEAWLGLTGAAKLCVRLADREPERGQYVALVISAEPRR